MKILILGATGFLGSTIYGVALKQKVVVYGTSRYQTDGGNIVQVDVTDKLSLEKIINQLKPDVVIWSLMSGENENVLIDLGLSNLLALIPKETKLIYVSTDAIFANGKGNYSETDQTLLVPKGEALSIYSYAKLKGEKLIVNSQHPNYAIIRTGPIYGKDLNQNIEKRTQRVINQLLNNEFVEAATNLYRTFVHVDDLSKAILEISSNQFNGILHLGPMEKKSYYSFYKERLIQLGFDNSKILPYEIITEKNPDLPLDTSLNTQRANKLLKTWFRRI